MTEMCSHLKIFHESNSLVTSLLKTVLSRNFCKKKSVRVDSFNFHTVEQEEGASERRSLQLWRVASTHISVDIAKVETQKGKATLEVCSSFAEDTAESRIRTWKKKKQLRSRICALTSTPTTNQDIFEWANCCTF